MLPGGTAAQLASALTPLPAPPVLPPVQQVSAFGRQVAEEFLSEYLSIFSFGLYHDNRFDNWRGFQPDDGVPLLYYKWAEEEQRTLILDRQGNEVSNDAPFINDFGLIANSFRLYDFDNDGIPGTWAELGAIINCINL
jgi:hypothetical protein